MFCTPGCLEMDWPQETSGCSLAHKLLLPRWHFHPPSASSQGSQESG